MAHQTSKTSQKQSTPHSIGRLMDADFALSSYFFLVASMSRELEQSLSCEQAPRAWDP
jgi:hypothetical protein